MKFINVLTDKQ